MNSHETGTTADAKSTATLGQRNMVSIAEAAAPRPQRRSHEGRAGTGTAATLSWPGAGHAHRTQAAISSARNPRTPAISAVDHQELP
jgi:hypothetical protein